VVCGLPIKSAKKSKRSKPAKNPAFERSISQFPGKKINSIFVGGGGWNIAILVM
jgi:hypothetical protein